MLKLFALDGYLNHSTIFATCFHSYSKLRFLTLISKVIIVEVPQAGFNVERFSSVSQNHRVLVLNCFERFDLVLLLKFIFIFQKLEEGLRNLQKIILLQFHSVSFHTSYTNWFSKLIFHIPVIIILIISNFNF
jgi:hypothetical protein